MNDFVQDVWHDLRAKRLWPIALVLLLGIVAIPAVLMKSSSAPAPAPTAADAVPQSPATPSVDLEVADIAGGGSGSGLDTLSEKNPFAPPAKIVKASKDAGGDAGTSAGASSDAGSAGGGAADGGSTDGSSGGSTGGGTSPGGSPVTKTTEYEYVADLTFWNGNHRRTVKGMHKLDMLPNQDSPVLIFMGVTDKGGNAIFLVDSTLEAAGEGTCVPSASNCAFVHVGPGSEEAFTTEDGDSYRLRIDEIRRVKVGGHAAATGDPAGASASDAAPRRFELPFLPDLVEVTETSGTESARPAAERDEQTTSDHAAKGR